MRKHLLLTISATLIWCSVFTQVQKKIDSLKYALGIATQDTSRVLIMATLSGVFRESNPDSAESYGEQALALANETDFPKGQVHALSQVGRVQVDLGNLPKALELQLQAIQIAENNSMIAEMAIPLNYVGSVYLSLNAYSKALIYYNKAKLILESNPDKSWMTIVYGNMGIAYLGKNNLDSALFYYQQAYNIAGTTANGTDPLTFLGFGDVQARLGNNSLALDYYKKGLQKAQANNSHRSSSLINNSIARLYKEINQIDSAIFYAKKGFAEAEQISFKRGILGADTLLSALYDPGDTKEALRYYKIGVDTKESLFGAGDIQAIQTMMIQEEERQKEIDAAKMAYQNQLKQYALSAGLGILLLIAFFLYRNNRQKKRANSLLTQQKEKIESTLQELKSTQSQLIQSEKMASLGELTAGIAHEIQNPLNFVNNFSEVSNELLDEMKTELASGNRQLATEIADDVKQNLEKILHHGKRADSIVKGMLQHSRISTGQKEPTDINALADECLRLSFHGMRMKDKAFNSEMKTDFDESIGKINIVSQDVSRVLINIINNAFYAVNERQKVEGEGYKPSVLVSTKKAGDKISIRVKDNGNGIPQKIVDKIFQPFFTTKPTGQGTGLGLSLSYDIVKAHGGEIKVNSKEGEGSAFVVQLHIT